MSYFFRTNNFDLDRYYFDIEVTPRFTKKEQGLLILLLDSFNEESEYSIIDRTSIKLEENEIKKIIFNLIKKNVYAFVIMEEGRKSELYFSLFDSIIIEGGNIIYKFSKEIDSGRKLGNFYTRINLLGILKFKYEYTRKIFKVILKENQKKGSLEYTLDEFKSMLNLKKDSYSRYYNLETKILTPIIRDIEAADVTLWFEKIKNTSAKTSRVVGIRVHYINEIISQIHKDTNELMKRYSWYIKDFSSTYEIIYNHKKFNTFEDTVKYIEENANYVFNEK